MKVLKLFAGFACVVGAIGGIGYALHVHQPVIADCIVVLAAAAAPTVIKWVKDIMA